MTSIEWLKSEYIKRSDSLPSGVFEDAKEMHKQEIVEAYCNGNDLIGAEQYYEETFVSKGSDEQYILNEATYRYTIEDEIEAFIKGAEWMQEQLKSKQ